MCSWDEKVNTKIQSLYMGFYTGLIEQNTEVLRFLSLKFWHQNVAGSNIKSNFKKKLCL